MEWGASEVRKEFVVCVKIFCLIANSNGCTSDFFVMEWGKI